MEAFKHWHGSYKSYLIGFIASIILTSLSFLLVIEKFLSPFTLMCTIGGIALTQAVFQLKFFLHLGQEEKPRWESHIFFLMLFFLLVITIGTLWIIYDLNIRTMTAMPHG